MEKKLIAEAECKPEPKLDDFQKQLLQMRPEEIRERLSWLPYETLQQVFRPLRPRPVARLVTIRVKIRRGVPVDLDISQDWKTLNPQEQIAWTCEGGSVEIRFDRKISPFIGDRFESPSGAKTFSGKPAQTRLQMAKFQYTVLVTTPDGYFLKKDAELVIDRKALKK